MFHDTWLCINLWLCCTCKRGCHLTLANIRGRYFVLVYVSQLWIVESDRRLLISNSFTHTSRILYEAPHLDQLITLESIGRTPSAKTISTVAQNLEFQSSAANVSRVTWFWVQEVKKRRGKTLSVPSMICVQCSYFNEINHKHTKKLQKNPHKTKL